MNSLVPSYYLVKYLYIKPVDLRVMSSASGSLAEHLRERFTLTKITEVITIFTPPSPLLNY